MEAARSVPQWGPQVTAAELVPEDGRLYRHYKAGALYRVITTSAAESNPDVLMITYISLETGKRWTRPLSQWDEPVLWPDGVRRARYSLESSKLPRPELDR